MNRAWIRACRESLWHITDPHDSGLALRARCGHIVWAPVHRRLQTPSVPGDDLCEACQSAASPTDDIRWPSRDPDSTTRLQGLSKALDLLDGLDRNDPRAL